MTTDPTTAPATVDGADLRAQLRQAIGDTWAGPDPVSAEDARAILDAVAGVLTAAGWTPAKPGDTPGTVEPDDAKPAPVDLGDEELRDSVAIALAAAEDEPVVSGHYALADAALAAVAAAGWPDHPRPARDSDQSWEMAVADVDQLTADVERLTLQLAQVTQERDAALSGSPFRSTGTAMAEVERLRGMLAAAQRDSAEHKAAAGRLAEENIALAQQAATAGRERDAERERADQLARDLAVARRVVQATHVNALGRELSAKLAEVIALRTKLAGIAGNADLVEAAAAEAFFVDDLGGHHKQGRQPHTWQNIPEQGRENYRALIRAVLAVVSRALLDDATPPPNATQPYADLCRAVVALADQAMRTAVEWDKHGPDCDEDAETLHDQHADVLAELARRMLALVPDVAADLIERIEAAIEEDAGSHPVSGPPNRDHWTGILIRHRNPTGHCWDAYDDRPDYDGPWCPEIVALARRLHLTDATETVADQ